MRCCKVLRLGGLLRSPWVPGPDAGFLARGQHHSLPIRSAGCRGRLRRARVSFAPSVSVRAKKKGAKPPVAARGPAEPRRSHLEPPTTFCYVDAVAHHGSIRKAAEALHVASSAVNRRILDLEDEIGFHLFERLPRGV